MNNPMQSVEYCAKKLAERFGYEVEGCQRARDEDAVLLSVRRRSFVATTKVRLPRQLRAQQVYDVMWDAMEHLDIKLRSDEIRAVFDFPEDARFGFAGIDKEEGRRIGSKLLRTFMNLVRGDEYLRNRVVEMAMAIGRHEDLATLIEARERRVALIENMDPADCEKLAIELMGRVDRIASRPGQ